MRKSTAVVSTRFGATPHGLLRGLLRLRRPAASEVDPRPEAGCRSGRFGSDQEPALHGPPTGEVKLANALLREQRIGLVLRAAHDEVVLVDADAHGTVH